MKGPAFIFARGGSKGVPNKNIRLVGGQPMIARAVLCALESNFVDEVIVSTDCIDIANAARKAGASVPFMRPADLATDGSPEILSWRHAIEHTRQARGMELDFFLSVPATSPLRETIDIDRCVKQFEEQRPDLVITVTPSPNSPWFNMVQLDTDARVEMLVAPIPGITRRQDAPKSFNITTVAYVANPTYVMNADQLLEGDIRAVEVPENRALDIDTEWDLLIAEAVVAKQTSQSTNP